MGRLKERYTVDETFELYKKLRFDFILNFLNIYNKSPVNTKNMLRANFDIEEISGINSMIFTMDKCLSSLKKEENKLLEYTFQRMIEHIKQSKRLNFNDLLEVHNGATY